MNSILEAMYGGGAGSKPKEPASGSGYYSSFGYYDDLKNNRPPPTADQGGPTALELAQKYGYADEQGMLSNGMHATVAAMYGGGMAPIDPTNNAMNPDWNAPNSNSTIGGIGNTDAWGNKVYWSPPVGKQLTEGEPFITPAGTYTVSKNPWGQYVLVPEDGAIQTNAPYVTNFTNGQHHVGIDPSTGEVWYQKAAGYYNYDREQGYTQIEGSPVAPNSPNDGGGNNGGNSGKSWLDVLGDKDLSDQFPEDSPWRNSGRQALSRENSEGVTQGLFASLKEADYYKRILESLGVV